MSNRQPLKLQWSETKSLYLKKRMIEATTPLGGYKIIKDQTGWWLAGFTSMRPRAKDHDLQLEELKAYAQKHFDATVNACLETKR